MKKNIHREDILHVDDLLQYFNIRENKTKKVKKVRKPASHSIATGGKKKSEIIIISFFCFACLYIDIY